MSSNRSCGPLDGSGGGCHPGGIGSSGAQEKREETGKHGVGEMLARFLQLSLRCRPARRADGLTHGVVRIICDAGVRRIGRAGELPATLPAEAGTIAAAATTTVATAQAPRACPTRPKPL